MLVFAVTPSDRAVIQKFMKPSLEKVQQAWTGEAQAVKRDRGTLFEGFCRLQLIKPTKGDTAAAVAAAAAAAAAAITTTMEKTQIVYK